TSTSRPQTATCVRSPSIHTHYPVCSTRSSPIGTEVKTKARPRINRVLSRPSKAGASPREPDAPRRLGPTLIDFLRLPLAPALRRALADAFWNQERVRTEDSMRGYWHSLKTFGRFAKETKAVRDLSDINSA